MLKKREEIADPVNIYNNIEIEMSSDQTLKNFYEILKEKVLLLDFERIDSRIIISRLFSRLDRNCKNNKSKATFFRTILYYYER